MKQAKIFIYDKFARMLTEDENSFNFQNDSDYLNNLDSEAISLTMPLNSKPYQDKVLFPLFDELIPECWLLNIAVRSWKINQRDRMSLLLVCYKDCIEAVSVVPVNVESEEE